MLKTIARAKINLTLRILGKSETGFHLIESITAFSDFGDEVEIFTNSSRDQLEISGPFSKDLEGDNIVVKALEYFRKETIWTQPITIKIFKQIPVAAGLGGGSADAACVLKMLNLLAPKARVSEEKMGEIGLNLGSDVPACLSGKTLKMEGRGEKLSIIGRIPNMPILLVNPNIRLSTKAVFETFSKKGLFKPADENANVDVEKIFKGIGCNTPNDLIEPAIKLAPVIQEVLFVLRKLKGIKTVGMSGSGATCFALFEPNDTVSVIKAEEQIKNYGWWTASTFLKGA
ncbi:MAG: 4-(cytidine 5'-diphospho)-2-C-methyl-D-erythritol kinase [Rhodospirillaceae bacterium]|nr:4-(cytidine 5'-diphospho)-2-C-methyl-D-erythritol kinase [Rhodospirillaceae bacterium]OUU59345.1 MAG: 4-(cytidine 5'-diphospho)-2-C-methyl-D-erythritol kinase [Candidatus Endolissoclinum sp. TMED55]|tara:strand:+ start:3724 stop:4584 length:861 start_codon:yes stop_codon:yes gene_type:complete